MLEVVSAEPPILLQVHCQIASNDLSSSVRHPTSLVHFSHESVYYRHTCHPTLPSLDDCHVSLPVVMGPVVDAIALEDGVALVHGPELVIVTPEKFAHIHPLSLVSVSVLTEPTDLMVYLSD